MQKPKEEEERVHLNSDTRRLQLLLLGLNLAARVLSLAEISRGVAAHFDMLLHICKHTRAGTSTVKIQTAQSSSMGQLNLEKIRAQLDLAEGGKTIRS